MLLSQLEEGHFVDRGGEFQLELSLSTARSVYEHRGGARRHFQYWSTNLQCDGPLTGRRPYSLDIEFCNQEIGPRIKLQRFLYGRKAPKMARELANNPGSESHILGETKNTIGVFFFPF